MHRAVPEDKQLPVPAHCTTASRVIQVLNMIQVRDLFDSDEVEAVKQDLVSECKTFGDIISVEVPRPCQDATDVSENDRLANTTLVSGAHGKIFIKFSHIVSAK